MAADAAHHYLGADPMTPAKRCTGRCARTLPLDAFPRDRTKRDGRSARCRECVRADRSERRRVRTAERHERDRSALAHNPTFRRYACRHAAALAALAPGHDPEAAERAKRIAAMADEALRKRSTDSWAQARDRSAFQCR